jgi:hypothetical protein
MKKKSKASWDEIIFLALLLAYFIWAIYDVKKSRIKVYGPFAQVTYVGISSDTRTSCERRAGIWNSSSLGKRCSTRAIDDDE